MISAALRPSGVPRAVVDTIRHANGILLFSDETFRELQTRFRLPKFFRPGFGIVCVYTRRIGMRLVHDRSMNSA